MAEENQDTPTPPDGETPPSTDQENPPETKGQENPSETKDQEAPPPKPEEEIDEDLAEALDKSDQEKKPPSEALNVGETLGQIDPHFKKELDHISSQDFSEASIDQEQSSNPVPDNLEVSSPLRHFLKNLPDDIKKRYKWALAVAVVTVLLTFLLTKLNLSSNFSLPYEISMDDLSKEVHPYPVDGVKVALFDELRSETHTLELPKIRVNLKSSDRKASYGTFRFLLVVKNESFSKIIQARQSEVIDIIQRSLESLALKELKTPMGKDRLKQTLRYRLNQFFEDKVIVNIYYRDIVLDGS